MPGGTDHEIRKETTSALVVTALAPSPSGLLDFRPVDIDPTIERSERLVEGSAEVGEPVEGCRFDSTGVEVTHNQAVPFGPAKGVGEYFVRDAIEGVVEVLVAETTVCKLSQHRESPTPGEQLRKLTGRLMPGAHGSRSRSSRPPAISDATAQAASTPSSAHGAMEQVEICRGLGAKPGRPWGEVFDVSS